MKPTLTFEKIELTGSNLGKPCSVPDLVGDTNVQIKGGDFHLGESEELYENYGAMRSSYPYTQFHCYDRELKKISYQAAILENDSLRAVFLPELGGRLWQLYDKINNRDILYTNDVLRFSNLAIRNAWFSGGVEWNISMIGHTPFTTAPLYTASLEKEDGTPVLRMYEYERVRQVEYQMDFWLEEKGRALNCRMRIYNSGGEVVPMYWWSNIAVPENKNGRIVVPAKSAYMPVPGGIRKITVPDVEGKDITHYENTERAIDYFFELEKDKPRYIVNLNNEGYGVLHTSSERLQSRKLFSWGHVPGSYRWQEYLTDQAGPYIEIQAGLGKSQWGCIPMAPRTSWEWTETYEAIQVEPELVQKSYDVLEKEVSGYVRKRCAEETTVPLEESVVFTKKEASLVSAASGYGRLKSELRKRDGDRPLSEHLDYSGEDKAVDFWLRYLEEGKLPDMPPMERPLDYICDQELFDALSISTQGADKDNWYAFYQMGVYSVWKGNYEKAEQLLMRSMKLQETPWVCHALASLYLLTNDIALANLFMARGLELNKNDLSYAKAGFKLLAMGGDYPSVIRCYEMLPEDLRNNDRLFFLYLVASQKVGENQKVYDLLMSKENFELEDVREGENDLKKLYIDVVTALYGECKEIPPQFDFGMG